MEDVRQEIVSQQAFDDVNRLLDRPGLKHVVTVAEQVTDSDPQPGEPTGDPQPGEPNGAIQYGPPSLAD